MRGRRVAVAVGVALAVLVLEVGVLGAMAAKEDGMPSVLTIPMPRVGDQARYTYQLVPSEGVDASRRANLVRPDGTQEGNANFMPNAPLTQQPYQDFAIVGPTTARLGDGTTFETYDVRVLQFGVDVDNNAVAGVDGSVEVDAATRHPVTQTIGRVATESRDGHRYEVAVAESSERTPPGRPSEAGSSHGVAGASARGGPLDSFLLSSALSVNLVQGKTLDTSEAVRILIPGDLDLPTFFDPSEGLDGGYGSTGEAGFDAPFRAVRTETVGTLEAVVFQARWVQSTKEIWLSPQVPYPLKLVDYANWGSENPNHNYVLTIQLDRLQAGSETLPLPGSGGFPSAPAAPRMAARQPWGLEESGTAAPFAASTAWRMLNENGTVPTGMVAVGSQFREHTAVSTERNTTDRRWSFTVSDGSQEKSISVTQRIILGPAASLVPPLVAGLLPRETTSNTTYLYNSGQTYSRVRPDPSRLPEELPTVAAVWESWRQRTGDARPPNAWGYSIDLSPDGTRNGVPVPRVPWASWEGGRRLSLTTGEDEVEESSILRFSRNGTVVRLESRQVMDGPGPSQAGIAAAPPSLAKASAVAWSAPAAPVVAEAGLVAVALGALASWFTKAGKGLGVLALFSRVQDRDVTHATRKALLSNIRAAPGIHFKELQRRVGTGRSSAQHHLAKLIAAGHVREVRTKGYTCYVPGDFAGREATAAIPVLRAAGARRLFAAILANPGLAQGELARRAGIQPSTASYHVQRLSAAGLVEENDGTLSPTPFGQESGRAGMVS